MRQALGLLGRGPALHEPGWLWAALYGALAAAAVCWVAWPGFMSFDSLLAYEQTFTGVQTMTWPPMHTYLLWLSRSAGLGPGGLLAVQTFVLFFGAAVALNLLSPNRWLALLAQFLFAGGFIYAPTLMGALLAQWRDVPTASFAVLAVALWLAAARYRSVLLLVAAAVAIGLGVSLRYNAILLVVGIAPLMVAQPYLGQKASAWVRVAVILALAASLGLAWASTRWRLPDLARPERADNFAGTQLFDLFGISACAGRDYLPGAVTEGATVTGDQIRRTYDPVHLHRTLAPKPGLPRFYETDGRGTVQDAWWATVPKEPGCYLVHRLRVFRRQMGMAAEDVFYPVHGGIDENRFGLALAHPEAALAARTYIDDHASEAWRRPGLLYLVAAAAALLAAWRSRETTALFLALLAGCAAYPLALFVAGPAADARYIFPSNVFCVLVIAVAFTRLFASTARTARRR